MPAAIKRRTLLAGGLLGAAAVGVGLRPEDRGGNHPPYFQALSKALDDAGISGPTLVVDRAKLLANVQTLKHHLGERYAYRIVAKSLPSVDLLGTIMEASNSKRLMLFHQPFLNQVVAAFPDTDILLGKPMPVTAAANYYASDPAGSGFDSERQLQWLIDTPQRLAQYATLAEQLGVNMRINIELDVGLHRGGVTEHDTLIAMLDIIQSSPQLQFSGFMGYEPHIVKVPGDPLDYRDRAMLAYTDFVATARHYLGDDWPQDVLLNCGGSPTYQMYDEGDYPFNELAAGSCLVKPTDFDIPTLADHIPASYIATPVLKAMNPAVMPVDGAAGIMAAWDRNRAQTFYTYGGYWKALPESPPGLSINPLMGRSTNQEYLNGSASINLAPDDWVFLRPTQSEFVFLQFGDIAVLEDGIISERWPILQNS